MKAMPPTPRCGTPPPNCAALVSAPAACSTRSTGKAATSNPASFPLPTAWNSIFSKTSTGCKLDDGRLTAAGAAVREAVRSRADLVFVNKFGHAEIENRGLLAEYLAAAAAGIPVLTCLHRNYLADWRDFCGGEGVELAVDADAAAAWALAAIAQRRGAGA